MIRRVALVLVLGLLLMACSPPEDEATTTTTSIPGEDSTSTLVPAPNSESPSSSSSPGAPEVTGSGAPGEAPVTTQGSAASTTAPAREGPTPRPTPGDIGAFGRYFLAADGATDLLIDVRVQGSVSTDAAAVRRLRDVLARESAKSVTVGTGSVGGGSTSWSAADIRAEADRARPAVGPGTGVVTVLYIAGGFAGSDTSLGVAVRSDVVAIFPDRIDEAAGLFGDPTRIETAVVVHELGHVLGLVDLVLATGRADPEHPGHSPSRDSVMYYAVESTLVGDLLAGGPPTEFDAADLRDLATIAGR